MHDIDTICGYLSGTYVYGGDGGDEKEGEANGSGGMEQDKQIQSEACNDK